MGASVTNAQGACEPVTAGGMFQSVSLGALGGPACEPRVTAKAEKKPKAALGAADNPPESGMNGRPGTRQKGGKLQGHQTKGNSHGTGHQH